METTDNQKAKPIKLELCFGDYHGNGHGMYRTAWISAPSAEAVKRAMDMADAKYSNPFGLSGPSVSFWKWWCEDYQDNKLDATVWYALLNTGFLDGANHIIPQYEKYDGYENLYMSNLKEKADVTDNAEPSKWSDEDKEKMARCIDKEWVNISIEFLMDAFIHILHTMDNNIVREPDPERMFFTQGYGCFFS